MSLLRNGAKGYTIILVINYWGENLEWLEEVMQEKRLRLSH
jgi:hypothetical protein